MRNLEMATATLLESSRRHFLKKAKSVDLENIIRECAETQVSWGLKQNDLMFAVAFWAMVECGFQSIPREDKPIKTFLPKNWKHETRQIYEAHFFLPPHSDYPVKLVALPTDDILCINILAPNVSSRNISLRSLAVHSTGYVPRPSENTIQCKFSGLDDFHLLLRSAIIWPIRCSILTDQGIMNGSLCGLSDEIKLKIVRHLTVKEILMLSLTCHDLNRICNDQGLWKYLFHQNFKNSCKCSNDSKEGEKTSDWKEYYKQIHALKQEADVRGDSPSASYHTAEDIPYGSEVDLYID